MNKILLIIKSPSEADEKATKQWPLCLESAEGNCTTRAGYEIMNAGSLLCTTSAGLQMLSLALNQAAQDGLETRVFLIQDSEQLPA